MAEPITEGGAFVPEEPATLHREKEIAQRIADLESIMGMIKAPLGFDARKISREDLYD